MNKEPSISQVEDSNEHKIDAFESIIILSEHTKSKLDIENLYKKNSISEYEYWIKIKNQK